MKKQEIINWLKCEDEAELEELWRMSDTIRQNHVGNVVHLRGLLEISNICTRDCHYCGIRSGNNNLERYRMTEEEIMACVQEAVDYSLPFNGRGRQASRMTGSRHCPDSHVVW